MAFYDSTVNVEAVTTNTPTTYILHVITTFSETETFVANSDVDIATEKDENGEYNVTCHVETTSETIDPNVVTNTIDLSSLDLEVGDLVNVHVFHGNEKKAHGVGDIKQTGSEEDVKPGIELSEEVLNQITD